MNLGGQRGKFVEVHSREGSAIEGETESSYKGQQGPATASTRRMDNDGLTRLKGQRSGAPGETSLASAESTPLWMLRMT